MNEYYNEFVLSDIDPAILLNPYFESWFSYVKTILLSDEFQKRKWFRHHHNMSVWDHSILVSFHSYMAAKWFHADERICAIAGLLHDFYPFAWLDDERLATLDEGIYVSRVHKKRGFFKQHGFVHAREAAKNYVKYFPELKDKKITDAIKRHMFPLNIIPPRYKEGFIITTVDKLNSCHELPSIRVLPVKAKEKMLHFLSKNRVH